MDAVAPQPHQIWLAYSGKRNIALHLRHNEPDGVSNHQPRGCLLNCLFRWRSRKTSKLRVRGLCAENTPGTGEFPAQKASNAENISIWWRHHDRAKRPHPKWYWDLLILLSRRRRKSWLPSNLWYKSHQITTLKCFSPRLAVAFAQVH